MDASVALSKESLITSTLCAFVVSVVLKQVGGRISFAPGCCLLFMFSSFSSPSVLSYVEVL